MCSCGATARWTPARALWMWKPAACACWPACGGNWRGWEWESALTWSDSSSDDITHGRISNTLFQQALNDETENAYNPFNGAGAIDCYLQTWQDCTPNDRDAINGFLVDVSRKGESDLLMVDLRVSRNDLLQLPAGSIGVAAGVEWRRESFVDDRDPRLDGTISFTDLVTGESSEFISDVMNSSPTPDSRGSRNVFSSYLEFAVPLVSPDMGLLLVQSVDMQIAARYETFSDVGSIVVPKVAMAWRLHNSLMLRGAVSEGFRAPNLVQVNESVISRENTRTDYYRCEVGLRDGSITDPDDCPDDRVQRIASGSDALVPEESTNYSFGIVVEPGFWIFRGLALTADWWKVEKEGTVGLFGEINHILLDTQIRLQNAQSDIANCDAATGNPAVIRAEAEADDDAYYAGSGLCPVGDVLQVQDMYVNLDKRTIEGWDFGLYWEFDDTPLGNFSLKANLAYIERFYQEPSARAQSLLDAQAQGILHAGIPISGAQELLQINGRPKIQLAGRLRWRLGDWGAGLSLRHVGKFYDTSATTTRGPVDNRETRIWEVEDWTTVSVNLDHHLTLWERELRLRIGATNLGNEDAPLADESYGYFGTLHNHLGRSIYFGCAGEVLRARAALLLLLLGAPAANAAGPPWSYTFEGWDGPALDVAWYVPRRAAPSASHTNCDSPAASRDTAALPRLLAFFRAPLPLCGDHAGRAARALSHRARLQRGPREGAKRAAPPGKPVAVQCSGSSLRGFQIALRLQRRALPPLRAFCRRRFCAPHAALQAGCQGAARRGGQSRLRNAARFQCGLPFWHIRRAASPGRAGALVCESADHSARRKRHRPAQAAAQQQRKGPRAGSPCAGARQAAL